MTIKTEKKPKTKAEERVKAIVPKNKTVAVKRKENPEKKSENIIIPKKTTSLPKKSKTKNVSDYKFSGKSLSGRGKRKRSVAFVNLYQSDAKDFIFIINEIEAKLYFKDPAHYSNAFASLKLITELFPEQIFAISVDVFGGGKSSQSDAIKLAIAKALSNFSTDFKSLMRKNGLTTTDARIVQPKKSGFKKARRKEQFSKR